MMILLPQAEENPPSNLHLRLAIAVVHHARNNYLFAFNCPHLPQRVRKLLSSSNQIADMEAKAALEVKAGRDMDLVGESTKSTLVQAEEVNVQLINRSHILQRLLNGLPTTTRRLVSKCMMFLSVRTKIVHLTMEFLPEIPPAIAPLCERSLIALAFGNNVVADFTMRKTTTTTSQKTNDVRGDVK
jgi:hypothetical protein